MQRDQDQEDCETEVIMEPKTASPPELLVGEDHLCQDSLYWLSPFKLARHCWLPSRSIFGKRTRASINRTSHHRRNHLLLDRILTYQNSLERSSHPPSTRTPHPQEAVPPLVLFTTGPRGNPPPPHWSRYYTTTVARTSINLVSLCVASPSSSSARS